MDATETLLLAAMFVIVALLYTTVGHAGASGYLAAMGLLSVAPEVMRPTALVLNIVVAAFATWRFGAARYLDVRALLPFAIGSVPSAFAGGMVKLPVPAYQALVGAVLLASAAILVWRAGSPRFGGAERPLSIPFAPSVAIGAAIGFLSGLTGVGGGIYLSPVILLMGWAGPRFTAGLAAPFIMVNSIAGLAGGTLSVAQQLPDSLPLLIASALGGALAGTWLGTRRLSTRALIATLAVVMLIAGLKLIARALAQ
jgi:hypothetical protein